ncbi:MAG: GNAT family N-acetyltransferase [Gammaproteobacteria bacterium]|nr:GNAT family N-acetyltransferase [Gammaproteobacteria bacterium]
MPAPTTPAFAPAPVVLSGRRVRLEPLAAEHLPALLRAGGDPAIWTWYPRPFHTPEGMALFVDTALRGQREGHMLGFATLRADSGEVVGSTRFCAMDVAHRRAEIGWTWLAPRYQRTAANTEAKYLMLRHAFETWGLNRVEFKTDSLNEPSRRALLRLGAREEGVFRNHMIMHTGRLRHSAYYSIIADEWPGVKAALEQKLARPSGFPD